jgi:3-deoxy-D-manno-octulosonic-acid transferase
MSDRSFARLRRIRPVARLVLDGVTRYLAASAHDEERLAGLGVPRERLLTTGNIKLDVQIPRLDESERTQLRRELGLPEGIIVLGSSTWPGEEAALLAARSQCMRSGRPFSLLLVPRHAERRMEVEQLLISGGVSYHFRSRGNASQAVDVAVADTTGELRRLTQLADLVFVGKSLAPHTEGQTPVEAAALEKPILFGPGMGNFRAIAADLVDHGAARRVPNAAALAESLADLLGDKPRRDALACAAAAWHRQNSGAIDRTLAIIRQEIARIDGRGR